MALNELWIHISSDTLLHIIIELDMKEKKAIAKLDRGSRRYEYDIVEFGSEIIACNTQSPEESIKRLLDDRILIEAPIYRLISKLGKGF